MPSGPVITIDGPAGSGKSTVARKLAARLGIAFLDTGAMYRALALKMLERKLDPTDEEALLEMTRQADLQVDCGPTHQRIKLDGRDVSEAIRTMEVSRATPAIARQPKIREVLVEHQRRIGRHLGAFVTEGRDQGTVAFPDADVKFVLDADVHTRVERRLIDLRADGEDVRPQDVLANLQTRDEGDKSRWAALLEPGQAIIIDTTEMSLGEVVDALEIAVRQHTQSKEASSK
ncbi:MAG: (d)CMP kinase [Phycisphaerales bacterium]|nr:MAG: (d)CMP kinase [Phycisphaerales bacterium]